MSLNVSSPQDVEIEVGPPPPYSYLLLPTSFTRASEIFSEPPPSYDECHSLNGKVGCTIMISITVVIPVFMIIVGSLKMDECPAEHFIPIYLVVGGAFGVMKNLLSFNNRMKKHVGQNTEELQRNVAWHRHFHFSSLVSFFLLAWFITGCVWVYRIYEPNFTDPSDSKYCDFVLYQFAFWLVTSVYITVGILSLCLCCLSVASIVMQQNHIAAQV